MTINDHRSEECPVTAVDAETQEILLLVLQSKMAQKATGAFPFGADLAQYPAWLFDAFVSVQTAIEAAERAVSE